jgi:hypothetical protein
MSLRLSCQGESKEELLPRWGDNGAFGRKQVTQVDKMNECRISNKEFRMMKFNDFDFLLRHSSFIVRYSAVRFRTSPQIAEKSKTNTLNLASAKYRLTLQEHVLV